MDRVVNKFTNTIQFTDNQFINLLSHKHLRIISVNKSMLNENKEIMEDRDRKRIDPENKASQTGAENRTDTRDRAAESRGEKTREGHRAEMDGKEGKIETEHTEPTDKTSAIPGAEAKEEGTASAGAGLGGNKGTGTRNKKDFS